MLVVPRRSENSPSKKYQGIRSGFRPKWHWAKPLPDPIPLKIRLPDRGSVLNATQGDCKMQTLTRFWSPKTPTDAATTEPKAEAKSSAQACFSEAMSITKR